jgi:hypothetical protein
VEQTATYTHEDKGMEEAVEVEAHAAIVEEHERAFLESHHH